MHSIGIPIAQTGDRDKRGDCAGWPWSRVSPRSRMEGRHRMNERGWNEHAYRRLIDAETHARRGPPMTAPLRIRRLAFMSADGGADLTALHARMAAIAGVVAEGPAWARQLEFERNGH